MLSVEINFLGRQEHGVGTVEMSAEYTKIIEIFRWTLPEVLKSVIHLIGALCKMRMDLDVEVLGCARHRRNEFRRADDNLSKREPSLHPLFVPPALHQP